MPGPTYLWTWVSLPGPRSYQGMGIPDGRYTGGGYTRKVYQREWVYQVYIPTPSPNMGPAHCWQVGGTHPTVMLSCFLHFFDI